MLQKISKSDFLDYLLKKYDPEIVALVKEKLKHLKDPTNDVLWAALRSARMIYNQRLRGTVFNHFTTTNSPHF